MKNAPGNDFDIASLLDGESPKLSPREQIIIARRIFSDGPVSLQELGITFGIGRDGRPRTPFISTKGFRAFNRDALSL